MSSNPYQDAFSAALFAAALDHGTDLDALIPVARAGEQQIGLLLQRAQAAERELQQARIIFDDDLAGVQDALHQEQVQREALELALAELAGIQEEEGPSQVAAVDSQYACAPAACYPMPH